MHTINVCFCRVKVTKTLVYNRQKQKHFRCHSKITNYDFVLRTTTPEECHTTITANFTPIGEHLKYRIGNFNYNLWIRHQTISVKLKNLLLFWVFIFCFYLRTNI